MTAATSSEPHDEPRSSSVRSVRDVARRHGVVVLVILVVAVIAGFGVTQAVPKTYTTETKVLLRPQTDGVDVSVVEASTLVADQVDTYAALVGTPSVLDPAITAAGVDTDSETLAEDVSASPVPQTTIVAIEVDAPAARDAAELANAIAASLVDQINDQSTVNNQALMTGVVVEEPLIPTAPSSPRLLLNLVVALAVGLAVSGAVVAVRESAAFQRPGRL